ncbi:MAG: TolB family protein [Lewinellaceae bacterium]|nr:TolB family protein [Lewinella sp.]MCB9279542.1 TolB family protein [Lewinellaceae bacterium]
MKLFAGILSILTLTSIQLFISGCHAGGKSRLGIFEGHGDIGKVRHSGSVAYNPKTGTYLIAGSGENMWFDKDELHYVWKKASGDISLAADIDFIGTGGNPHRKACLIIRQDLSPDGAYADAVIHGDGLNSIQYRETKGGITREIQSGVSAPSRIKIEKEGDYVSMYLAGEGEPLHAAGGTFKIRIRDPFYIGLGVCAHDPDAVEKAVFSNVEIRELRPDDGANRVLESTLETVPIASGDRRVVYHTRDHIEAPNWSGDGGTLYFNQQGHIYTIPVGGGNPTLIPTGTANQLNNDHGLSPDGKLLAISDQSLDGKSYIYTVPSNGGIPRRITERGPSYWHGWSPDGKTLAYCGERNGEYDIFTIPVDGGEERRLTTAKGLDDGPDYSPDGRYIYFNSVRSGLMQIWRMRADGSREEQVTRDQYNNWFPHPSPDGQWIVFLSYEKEVEGHPANQDVMLRIMPADGGEIRVLAKLFGGQGTINVPSWSPDSQKVAFVSYRMARVMP